MSMHKKPLTPIEESGLRAHGLDIGTPSQLSDAFRQGVSWGLSYGKKEDMDALMKAAERWRMLTSLRDGDTKEGLILAWYDVKATPRIDGLGGRDPVRIIDAAIEAQNKRR